MTDGRRRRQSRGTGDAAWGTAFDRWWPRVAAVAQLVIGAWTFLHPVWTRGPEALAGQFWSVALMAGAPTAVFALRTIAERAGRLSGGG